MFDGLKNVGAMASLMKDLPKMQARMQEVRDSLAEIRVAGASADGLVEVIAGGDLKIHNVQISEAGAADSLLQERVREAANAALTAAQAEAHARLSAVAAEMGLPTPSAGELSGMGQLPGMDM